MKCPSCGKESVYVQEVRGRITCGHCGYVNEKEIEKARIMGEQAGDRAIKNIIENSEIVRKLKEYLVTKNHQLVRKSVLAYLRRFGITGLKEFKNSLEISGNLLIIAIDELVDEKLIEQVTSRPVPEYESWGSGSAGASHLGIYWKYIEKVKK